MAIDVGALRLEHVAAEVAALSASVFMLKQWLRSDISTLAKRLDTVEAKSSDDFEKLDTKFSNAITRLADTVETYVRSSANDRLRTLEMTTTRDREMEVKVTQLEGTVDRLDHILTRALATLDDMARRHNEN